MDVDFLMLADYAEAINGKIYVQGGGWDNLTVNQPFPFRQACGVALGLRVGWSETNVVHRLRVVVVDDDTQAEVASVEGQIEVGRAPGTPAGISQFVPVAFNVPLEFHGPATCVLRLTLDGEDAAAVAFRVVAGTYAQMAAARG
jgi:hypothetical protein